MEGAKLHAAKLDEETMGILLEAESAINKRLGVTGDRDQEVYLIALNRNQSN